MDAKFIWYPGEPEKVGSDPDAAPEVSGALDGQYEVIVGVGAYIGNSNFETLALWVSDIQADGTLGEPYEKVFGEQQGAYTLQASGQLDAPYVVTGVGMAAGGRALGMGVLTTLWLYARELDPNTGVLSANEQVFKYGEDKDKEPEAVWHSSDQKTVITAIAARASDKNVTTLNLGTGALTPNTN